MTSGLRKVVFLALLVGVAVAGYQYMIKPANKHLAESKVRVEAKIEKLNEFEKATAAAKDLNQQVTQLEEAIKFFESKLPPTSKIHEVLEQVTVIAQTEGLEPKTIRTVSTKENNGYIEQPLEMALAGDFKSFYSFLLELEKLPRIMKIRELKIDKEKTEEGRIVADFVVSIFFQNKTT